MEKRISRAAKIFLPGMWRNIMIQGVYQILVVLTLEYFGGLLFIDDSYNLITTTLRVEGEPTDKMRINTLIFYTYFLMNMVN